MRFLCPARLASVTALVVLSACDRQHTPVEPAAAATAKIAVAASAHPRPDEAHFDSLAAAYPDFAGYVIGSAGELVVRAVNPERAGAWIAAVERDATARGHIVRRPNAPARALGAQFSWRSLAAWRDAVTEFAFDIDGVNFVDLDEARNTVTVGISAARFQDARVALLARSGVAGVPAHALHFKTNEPTPIAVERASGSAAVDQFLNDEHSVLRGGIWIVSFLNGAFLYNCTAGIVVDYYGARYLLTNSHCSEKLYALDATAFGQPTLARQFGTETHDTHYNLCNWKPCRYSDATLIALNGQPMANPRGTVARTLGGVQYGEGSETIDQGSPFFSITSTETSGHPVGTQLNKIGRTTGWTYGPVSNSCIDVLGSDGAYRKCSTRVSASVQGGDSGAPVFYFNYVMPANTARFHGIVWGGTTSYFDFSGYRSVERDFGVQDQGIMVATYAP